MALTWEWKEKSGTITMNGATRNWWEGNAMMIILSEFVGDDGKDKYCLDWYICDESHAKNMFGMSKNYKENVFAETPVEKLVIYRKHCRQWEKIVKIFTKAFPKIVIELREEE